jgi:superfamily II DNA or RNA helicase
MNSEKDYYLYELQCIKYHQETYGHQSWHWTQIPENVLFESGFIHDGNEYRLKRKLKWEENQEYYNPLQEYGLDGIALEINNDEKIYHGIQCKLWKNKLSANSLGTFLLSIFARLNKKNQNSKGYLYHSGPLEINLKNDLEQIQNTIYPIQLDYYKVDEQNNNNEEKNLYDYQKEAVQKLDIGWNNVGYLILPCGTGKTVIFSEHLKNQNYKNIIIVSPLRIQVKQTLKTVRKYIPKYNSILLDSDEDGSNDFQEIEKRWNQNLLISTTFKSFQDILIKIFYEESKNYILESRLDLSETILIIDEAHNIINLNKIIQIIESFPRVLLVTATPPSIMEELIVGDIIYQYSMQKAIENHYICDYEIYLPALEKKLNSDFYIEIPDEIDIDNENETLYKKAIFLIEGLLQTSSRKCIVYISDINSCYLFENIIKKIIENYYYIPSWIGIINCNTLSDERDNLINKFQENELKSEIRLLISVRILDEGIDIPKCDSIFITSVGDYTNDIRMIQRLCRATRIDKGNINKKASCFIWTENMEKINRSLKILKENDINFIGKIKYNKKTNSKKNDENDIISITKKIKKEKTIKIKIDDKKFNEFHICPRCKLVFDNPDTLQKHMNKKIPCKDIFNGYKCPLCNKEFVRSYHLKRHIEEVCLIKNKNKIKDIECNNINTINALEKLLENIKKKTND